jgi:ketosteroid isomerase-like protein
MRRSSFPVAITTAAALAIGLSACGSSDARAAAKTQPTAETTATKRAATPQPFAGTGSARLLRDAPKSSTWTLNGTVTVTGLGRGTYHQSGTFTSFEHWTAKQTITAPNGDTLTSDVVGGVIADTPTAAKIKTTETITGGTGRFAGARGKTITMGATSLSPNGNQVFTFHFTGSLTSTASARAVTGSVSPTPLDLVRAEIQAFNRGDVASAVALFTPDAVLVTSLGGCNPCIGRDAIRDHWSRAVASQTTIGIDAPHESGGLVTASSSLRSPSLPDGVQRAIGTLTVTISHDKIKRWEQTYDLKYPQTAKLFAAVGIAPSSATSTP